MKTILVTVATGLRGAAVIESLLKNNFIIKALSRKSDSVSAQLLISKAI